MDWIGITGLNPSWVPPACYKETQINDPTGAQKREVVLQPPNICLQGPKAARIEFLKWLRTTCVTKLIVQTTYSALLEIREAGWTPDELVLTIGNAGNILDTPWYFVVESTATEFWYPKRFDCGLMRISGKWYHIPDRLRPAPNDSSEEIKVKYEQIVLLEEKGLSDIEGAIPPYTPATAEEVKRCTEGLLHYFLKWIYEKVWETDSITPFYGIYMDEPWKHFPGDRPQMHAILRGLYDAIRRGRESGSVYLSGDGYGTYFGVGGYDSPEYHSLISFGVDVDDVAGYADFVFDTKYESDWYVDGEFPFFHSGTDDQSRDWFYWKEHEPAIAEKMRGSWIHLEEDIDEIGVLVNAAISLGWRDLYVFPRSDEVWTDEYGDDWKAACKDFRERVKALCDEIKRTTWLRGSEPRYAYQYCKYYPDCQKCSKNRPEDWTTERPEGFPSIDRGPAQYLPGFGPEAFIEGRRFIGESDR